MAKKKKAAAKSPAKPDHPVAELLGAHDDTPAVPTPRAALAPAAPTALVQPTPTAPKTFEDAIGVVLAATPKLGRKLAARKAAHAFPALFKAHKGAPW